MESYFFFPSKTLYLEEYQDLLMKASNHTVQILFFLIENQYQEDPTQLSNIKEKYNYKQRKEKDSLGKEENKKLKEPTRDGIPKRLRVFCLSA